MRLGFRSRTSDERPGWILWWCCRVKGIVARVSLATPLRELSAAVPIDVICKIPGADRPSPTPASGLRTTMMAYGTTYNCEQ